jgi:hypothetical protein
VRRPSRHEHEAPGCDGDLAVAETKGRLTVRDIERLVRVRVNMKRGSWFAWLEDPDDGDVGSARLGLAEVDRIGTLRSSDHGASVDDLHWGKLTHKRGRWHAVNPLAATLHLLNL